MWLLFRLFGFSDKVRVPRELLVNNQRLGVLLGLLRWIVIFLVLFTIFLTKKWRFFSRPEGGVEVIWAHLPSAYSPEYYAPDRFDVSKDYCKNPSKYEFVWDGNSPGIGLKGPVSSDFKTKHQYKPTGCTDLHDIDRWSVPEDSAFTNAVFIPTFLKDTWVESKAGVDCNVGFKTECTAKGGVYELFGVSPDRIWRCQCAETSEKFVSNAENLVMDFHYDYTVLTSADERSVQEGGSRSDVIVERAVTPDGKEGEAEETKFAIETEWRKKNWKGEAELYNSKNPPHSSASQTPLQATVTKILDAASKTLEDDTSLANSKVQTGVKEKAALRLTGGIVSCVVSVTNQTDDPVLALVNPADTKGPVAFIDCKLKREGHVGRRTNDAVTKLGSKGEGSTYRRTANGILIEFSVSGSFAFFSWFVFSVSLTQVVVLSGIPRAIVIFVALYLLGLLSRLYRTSAKKDLDISKEIFGFSARLMNAKNSFDTIRKKGQIKSGERKEKAARAGEASSPARTAARKPTGVNPEAAAAAAAKSSEPLEENAEGDAGISIVSFAQEMKGSFSHLIEKRDALGKFVEDSARVLQPSEFRSLCRFVYGNLDMDRNGGIGIEEFINAVSTNELLSIKQVAKFFDTHRRRGCLEAIFDDQNFRRDMYTMRHEDEYYYALRQEINDKRLQEITTQDMSYIKAKIDRRNSVLEKTKGSCAGYWRRLCGKKEKEEYPAEMQEVVAMSDRSPSTGSISTEALEAELLQHFSPPVRDPNQPLIVHSKSKTDGFFARLTDRGKKHFSTQKIFPTKKKKKRENKMQWANDRGKSLSTTSLAELNPAEFRTCPETHWMSSSGISSGEEEALRIKIRAEAVQRKREERRVQIQKTLDEELLVAFTKEKKDATHALVVNESPEKPGGAKPAPKGKAAPKGSAAPPPPKARKAAKAKPSPEKSPVDSAGSGGKKLPGPRPKKATVAPLQIPSD